MLVRVVSLAVVASATFDTNFASSIVKKRLEYELGRALEMSNTIARATFSGSTLINASGGHVVDPERMRAHMWPLFYTANARTTTNPLTYVRARESCAARESGFARESHARESRTPARELCVRALLTSLRAARALSRARAARARAGVRGLRGRFVRALSLQVRHVRCLPAPGVAETS